jgi:hypothetical protein
MTERALHGVAVAIVGVVDGVSVGSGVIVGIIDDGVSVGSGLMLRSDVGVIAGSGVGRKNCANSSLFSGGKL